MVVEGDLVVGVEVLVVGEEDLVVAVEVTGVLGEEPKIAVDEVEGLREGLVEMMEGRRSNESVDYVMNPVMSGQGAL